MKPIDPATRLSDLLAQSLEELTRPFESPATAKASLATQTVPERPPAPAPAKPAEAPAVSPPAAQPGETPPAHAGSTGNRDRPGPPPGLSLDLEAERALAELEAELFAATKKASEAGRPAEDARPDDGGTATADQAVADQPDATPAPETPAEVEPPPPPADAAAAQLIARVRRLMIATMLVTLLAVGSVLAFIGYRIYKAEETIDKKVDKIVVQEPAPPPEVTLSLPRNARIIQAGVAEERLVITLEIDGKIEVRVFDVKTLEPAARMGFSTTP